MDGCRALAQVADDRCSLISRKNNAYKSFGRLREALAGLRVRDAVLDGEIVCLNSMKAARDVHKVQGNLRRFHSIGLVKEATMNAMAKQDEHPDHLRLTELLKEAKPLMLPMYSDQQKVWVAQSPIAQEIKSILAKHPEYYPEVSAVVGDKAFPKPK